MAAALGLGAGVSPGPLLTLVVTATLQRGFGAGARVALAPLITDLPVVVLAMLVLQAVPASALATLSIIGGGLVGYLGFDTLRQSRDATVLSDHGSSAAAPSHDLWRGALVNVISPHPWLAWITVLGPLVSKLADRGIVLAGGFLVLFYAGLIGAKLAIAGLVARGRRHLSDRSYRLILVLCGILLLVLGGLLILQGFRGTEPRGT